MPAVTAAPDYWGRQNFGIINSLHNMGLERFAICINDLGREDSKLHLQKYSIKLSVKALVDRIMA